MFSASSLPLAPVIQSLRQVDSDFSTVRVKKIAVIAGASDREWLSAGPEVLRRPGPVLPVGAELVGYLLQPPRVGQALCLMRESIEPGKSGRLFVSSPVRQMVGQQLITEDAVYVVTGLDQAPEAGR